MSNTSIKIDSQDLTIESLYKDFYTVPDFQREYVWEQKEIEKLLQDISDEFYDEEGILIKGNEYFLGTIVVSNGDNQTYHLVDGQQRMTTIYLILCAIRDLLIEMEEEPLETLKSEIASSTTTEDGEQIFNHRLVLQYEDSKGILELIANKQMDKLDSIAQTVSVIKIKNAYDTIKEFLKINYIYPVKRLRQFYAALTKRVKIIRIKTPSLTGSLKVFETINDRGVGLDAMDLLKNLLFMKTQQEFYPQLKNNWKELIDTLNGCNEKPLRFLRYYIMSHFDLDSSKPLREDDIYDWFVDNTDITKLSNNPLGFLRNLIECAKAWSNISNAKDIQGKSNPYLKNLGLLSGVARQHFILLLAGRHLSQNLFSHLCKYIENFFFCYTITREPTKVFERNFSKWSKEVRECTTERDLNNFIELKLQNDMKRLSNSFDFAFKELTQSKIQKYRMRYILAKLTQYVEQQAWNNLAHTSLDNFIDSTVEIEHILPVKPTQKVKNSFDKVNQYENYLEMLGNLTLLEKTINASVQNEVYNKKVPGYKQSSFLLTKSLVEKPNVGVNTSLNRAMEKFESYTEWNSTSIESRQNFLANLARRVWEIPKT